MSRIAVLITGAIALALVARAASIYRGGDPLAFGLVLLIGVGLVLGVAELLLRATQAIRLQNELATLPALPPGRPSPGRARAPRPARGADRARRG